MKKKIISGLACLALAGATVAGLTACDNGNKENNSGTIFHIYCWNQEFKGFFNKYVSDEKNNDNPNAEHHLDGIPVKWTETTSDNGAYQNALDTALRENKDADEENRVDMFLAEADYILKYTNTSLTKNVKDIGVDDFSNAYQYTVDAASDKNGVVKGVSFQCCPAGMVYCRSIAKDVLGTDDPQKVQEKVNSWEKFDSVAAQMKAKGYYITASYADTYRVFSNNADHAWVDENKNLTMPTPVKTWMDQAENYVKKGYTKTDGVWDAGKTNEFTKDGKAFCTFGPAWYYNFCMGTAMGDSTKPATDPINVNKSYGDWAVVQGPQAYFWGGTWMIATADGNNDKLVAKTMNAFLNNEEVCEKLVKDESQFSNNKKVNEKVAAEYTASNKGNGFLNGQNDTQIWVDMADSIKFKYNTIYDQQCNEGLQTAYVKYLKGDAKINSKEEALKDFYAELTKTFPNIKTN